jgi:cellulose biosynthesis protein BcsQ
MEIIAIVNEKGGVAKTTTTISLAGALVDLGYDVLAVDLDTQANLTLGLGAAPTRLRRSVADVLMNNATIASVSRETSIPGLDLVPSCADMGLAERFLPMRQGYETILKNALKPVMGRYAFILLDCPPSLGAVTYNAMTAATRVIAPTQPEYFSAFGLRSVMAMIRRVRGVDLHHTASPQTVGSVTAAAAAGTADEVAHIAAPPPVQPAAPSANPPAGNPPQAGGEAGSNPDLVYHILITMMDRRNRIHRTLAEQLKATFGEGLFETVIETDTKLRESTVAGLPITHYVAQSRSAIQYRQLAEEIISYAS